MSESLCRCVPVITHLPGFFKFIIQSAISHPAFFITLAILRNKDTKTSNGSYENNALSGRRHSKGMKPGHTRSTCSYNAKEFGEYTSFQNGDNFTIILCQINWPLLPRFRFRILLNSADAVKDKRVN